MKLSGQWCSANPLQTDLLGVFGCIICFFQSMKNGDTAKCHVAIKISNLGVRISTPEITKPERSSASQHDCHQSPQEPKQLQNPACLASSQ